MLDTWDYIRKAYQQPAEYGQDVADPTRPDGLGYEILARHRPEVLHGYITLRKGAKNSPRPGLSDAVKELIIVAIEAARLAPSKSHAVRAVKYGATVGEVAETVSLCMMIGGMLTYQYSGKDALKAAEEAATKPPRSSTTKRGARKRK
jgi:alkylhydroperoxidase/carboxymuconolactone decarboxylase family protein YurZ